MRLFLVLFILEGFVSIIFKSSIAPDILTTIWMFVNSIYLIVWFYNKSDDKTMFYILVIGLFIRLLAMFYDQEVSRLPFNTGDAYKFQETAISTARALPGVMESHFTGFYAQVLGVIYYIFGENLYLGHFLNIVFVMLSATKLIDIAHMQKMSIKNINILAGLWLFMPIPFLMGYALLREASIYYFVVLSAYYFLKWFEKYSITSMIMSLVCVYIAALYHEGIIVMAAAYLYTYFFYNKKEKKISINILNILSVLIVVGVAFGYVSQNSDKLLSQTNAETGGGSSYLASIDITNPIQFFIFAPIKGFYLLFSPMPWLIRGGLDVLTFGLDVSVWVLGFYIVIRNFKSVDTKYKMLLLAVLVTGMMYGMGTHNTGTAIRHRNKVLALVLVAGIGAKDKVEKEKLISEGEKKKDLESV